jgi:hypothetical protein
VEGIHDAEELALGSGHSCARRRSGDVVCWGWQQPGLSTIAATVDLVSIDAEGARTCGVRRTGEVVCWSWDRVGVRAPTVVEGLPAEPATVARARLVHPLIRRYRNAWLGSLPAGVATEIRAVNVEGTVDADHDLVARLIVEDTFRAALPRALDRAAPELGALGARVRALAQGLRALPSAAEPARFRAALESLQAGARPMAEDLAIRANAPGDEGAVLASLTVIGVIRALDRGALGDPVAGEIAELSASLAPPSAAARHEAREAAALLRRIVQLARSDPSRASTLP